MIEKINIERFLELAKECPLLDVRSPGEYSHAHIPGAINFPLFTDEQRKLVGTAYKQESRAIAIRLGLDFFGPKMRSMVEQAEEIMHSWKTSIGANPKIITESIPQPNGILVHCWRGGMRSAAIAWLLDLYGFKVYTLNGGYKRFRNYVLNSFKKPFSFNILGGYTGSGKTELLNALREKGEQVIDLEALANHKGSAFGNIGLPAQPSQEMFENLLALALTEQYSIAIQKESPIWLEDESQRIGLVNIPGEIWKTMRSSPIYFLDIEFENRLLHIVEEYGNLDGQKMKDAILRIQEKLGGLNAKLAIGYLDEGNTIESFRILLKYYDKYYHKALHNREGVNSLLQRIETKSISLENAILLIHSAQKRLQKA